ncbi:MAG: hypothetical protein CL878_05255 [Dehalococcoidia bacterium]|nr:hypothetical protein [Dehalococcoidia bacterium]
MSVDVAGAEAAGVDAGALRRAFGLLEGWVGDHVVPGAAALIARHGQVAGTCYAGTAEPRTNRPVDASTVFSLASITKPVTATAVMQCVERGWFALDEPIGILLPEFLNGPASGPNVPERATVTVRHLLTHTSGLPGFSAANMRLRRRQAPLEDFVSSFQGTPLFFAPGTAHLYSNCGILLLAELVGRGNAGTLGQRSESSAVSHYHKHVHQQILDPLEMASSWIPVPEEAWGRVAHVADTSQEGTTYEAANSAYYRRLGIPWGGLFATAADLARFTSMFMPGVHRLADGNDVLAAASRDAMTRIQVSVPPASPDAARELRDSGAVAPWPQVEWGLGWEVKGRKTGHVSGDLTSPQTFSHIGVTGTLAWGDPVTGVVCILLTNRMQTSGWTSERPRRALFSNAVTAAMAEV